MTTRSASQNIAPDDPRYSELVRRGFNKRFEGRPDYVRLVGSADDVVDAVQKAARSGRRLGGRVNTVASDATAASQRASVIDSAYAVGWMDPADEARSLAWVRELYGEVFAQLGDVPVLGAETEQSLATKDAVLVANPCPSSAAEMAEACTLGKQWAKSLATTYARFK
jgi:hypothetical protein